MKIVIYIYNYIESNLIRKNLKRTGKRNAIIILKVYSFNIFLYLFYNAIINSKGKYIYVTIQKIVSQLN
jgi:hypothetical protein